MVKILILILILKGTRYGQEIPAYKIEKNMSNYLITAMVVTKHNEREHSKHTTAFFSLCEECLEN